jgi:hypothetical protein
LRFRTYIILERFYIISNKREKNHFIGILKILENKKSHRSAGVLLMDCFLCYLSLEEISEDLPKWDFAFGWNFLAASESGK